jgi:3-oxoacyl-[acyl-carrier protein] reductase
MKLGIDGKRALVTASSRGLGLGIARAIAAEGADVLLTGRDAEKLATEAARLGEELGRTVPYTVADLSNPEGREALAAHIETLWGGLDILVNNTGGPPNMPTLSIPSAQWGSQLEAMVLPVTELTARFAPGMKERGWGRILTVGSSGIIQPIAGLGLSNALRAALQGWSKTLSAELAPHGVTVNMILPGRIHTERVDQLDALAAERTGKSADEVAKASRATIPAGRYGRVEEFAAVANFLVSGPASYVTGTSVRVDGGIMRSV